MEYRRDYECLNCGTNGPIVIEPVVKADEFQLSLTNTSDSSVVLNLENTALAINDTVSALSATYHNPFESRTYESTRAISSSATGYSDILSLMYSSDIVASENTSQSVSTGITKHPISRLIIPAHKTLLLRIRDVSRIMWRPFHHKYFSLLDSRDRKIDKDEVSDKARAAAKALVGHKIEYYLGYEHMGKTREFIVTFKISESEVSITEL